MRVLKELLPFVCVIAACSLAHGAAPPVKKPASQAARTTVQVVSAEAVPLLQKGITASGQGQYVQAEQYFKLALSKMSPADSNQIVACTGLARIYYKQGNYPQAILWSQKSHPLIVKRQGSGSIPEADNLFVIANSYHLQKLVPQAEAGYRRIIPLYEALAKTGKYSINYNLTLQNMGVIEAQKNAYTSSAEFYRKALLDKQARQDADTGQVLENLGICYQHLQQPEQAIAYYQQALEAYQKVQGSDSKEAKKVYFTLANLQPSSAAPETVNDREQYNGQYYEAGKKLFNEKNYAEAVPQLKLALAQAMQFYPNEGVFIADLQLLLGQAMYISESEEPAEPYLEKALAYQQQQHLPANHETLVHLHRFLGLVYNRKTEYEPAERHVQYVLEHSPSGTQTYASLQALQGEILCHEGKFKEGRALYEQAIAYYQQSPATNEKAIKGIQYQLALLDKMFQSQSQGLAQYFEYSVTGLRRWNEENETIRILLNSGQALENWNEQDLSLVHKAFSEWQTALDNKIRFEFTDDTEKYDVAVNWSETPISETELDAKVGVYKLETIRSFFLRAEIVLALAKDGKPRSQADIYAATLHEIGHMLGLSHSADLTDIMSAVGGYSYSHKEWPTLSERDIQAARILYQQKAVVSNPKGITLAEYQKFNDLVKEGTDFLKDQRYPQAFHALSNARTLYADDPYANFYCGLSAFRKGDYKEAKEIFEDSPMPEANSVFSVDSQLGLIYVELGHKYNRWGKKNQAVAAEFYDKGVQHLKLALQKPDLPMEQRSYLFDKLKEGQMRQKPEPVYSFNYVPSPIHYSPGMW